MKKIKLFLSLTLAALIANPLFCQVGIGTLSPDKSAALDVVSPKSTTPLGALIPRMSENDRDSIQHPANGLLIFNTDEECINAFDADNNQWNSLCGGIAKSTVIVNCDEITVYGDYMKGSPLNSSNYLSMIVNVVKAGAYTILATTTNGYGFSASGTFLTTGLQKITLAGQGSPIEESSPGDEVDFIVNGAINECKAPAIIIPVASANPSFTMDCGLITVFGLYTTGIVLKPTNFITISVNVLSLGNGQWSAETNAVDGISFSGNGIFTELGNQTITLSGHGTPASAKTKNLTVTVNSAGIAKTCTAVVNCVYTLKKIAVMGYAAGTPFGGAECNTYGYELTGNRLSYLVAITPVNFGTTATSTVQVQGFNITGVTSTNSSVAPSPSGILITSRPTDATLQAALANNPDIVIIGWGMIYSPAMIDAFINYLNDGGVMIIMNKYSNSTPDNSEAPFFRALFGTNDITASTITNTSGTVIAGGNSTHGSIFQLASLAGDPVLNGPFGNLNGLLWGNDYFPATYMSGIPADQIIAYSGANVVGSNSGTGVTMFRHKTLNLFWVGDGGFLSSERTTAGNYVSLSIEPFSSDANFRPIDKPAFGNGIQFGGSSVPVCNSRLFCNVLAWAIQQAENNGVNAGK